MGSRFLMIGWPSRSQYSKPPIISLTGRPSAASSRGGLRGAVAGRPPAVDDEQGVAERGDVLGGERARQQARARQVARGVGLAASGRRAGRSRGRRRPASAAATSATSVSTARRPAKWRRAVAGSAASTAVTGFGMPSVCGRAGRRASDANDLHRYDRDMPAHRVACLAFEGLAPFELGVAAEVFALPRPELDVGGLVRVRAVRGAAGPARRGRRLRGRRRARARGARARGHGDRARRPGPARGPAGGRARRAARGPRPRRAGALDLLRRVRARGGRPARRRRGRDALALRGAAAGALPGRARERRTCSTSTAAAC